MKVSDQLTYLAEAILDFVLQQAWRTLTQKYGVPEHLNNLPDQPALDKGLAMIGYGKLGGWELGYHSDLDLVFIHNCPAQTCTNGPQRIDSHTFYIRLVQKVVSLLTTKTTYGALYEIDIQLRPAGKDGLLVTSMQAFQQYQAQQAWLWEHQALVRARVVFGHLSLRQQFAKSREAILAQKRDTATLKKSITDMRRKMHQQSQLKRHFMPHSALSAAPIPAPFWANHLHEEALRPIQKRTLLFHLKQDPGGVIDIEFLAQYWVLALGYQDPMLRHWPDNVRIFETLKHLKVLSVEHADQLHAIYIALREAMHQCQLRKTAPLANAQTFCKQRHFIRTIWWRTLYALEPPYVSGACEA